jgi:hypothetical protein
VIDQVIDGTTGDAFQHARLPLELVLSTAWRYRALEADVLLRRITEAPRLFTLAGAQVAALEKQAAGAWATWWQFTSYGVVGRLP